MFNTAPRPISLRLRTVFNRKSLLAASACAGLLCAALPALAYTPQVFNAALDTGQDFTQVPANTAWNASNGINRNVWNNIFSYGGKNPGPQFWFAGSTGLWISSSSAQGWPSTGMMQQDTTCSAGFGYGDFHWRSAEGQSNNGPGANEIMWPADGDPAWPGIIKNSDNNQIGEVDVNEVNYGSNGTLFSTFHFFNAGSSGNDGSIMHTPVTYPVGDMTSMHDYDIIWGPGSLVLKVDGVVQMSAPPTQVRADYAHGGCNYTLGAQMAMQATAYDKTPDDWIEIAGMWWSATDQSAGSGTSTPISAPTPLPPSTTPVAGPVPVTPTPTPTPTPVPTPTPAPSGGLSIVSLAYSSGTLSSTVDQTIAGGIRFMIDGVYAGTARDSSPVGTHHLTDSFAKAPAAGTHTVTYYLTNAQSTSSVTGSFVVP